MSVIDDIEQEIQDLSDNTDSSFGDVQNTLNDHSNTLDDLNNTAGQLQFPLTQDTIDLIKEQFPTGQITLASGTYTLQDGRISANSIILYCITTGQAHNQRFTLSGSAPYTFTVNTLQYSVVVSAGQAVFTSTDNADTSTLSYLIL